MHLLGPRRRSNRSRQARPKAPPSRPATPPTPFLKWGEPLFADAPAFDSGAQTAAAQAKQVGYNCDFSASCRCRIGSDTSDHGLLVVNHEYTNPELMFPGYLVPNPGRTRTPGR